jgi:hypothetical protein
MGGVIARREPHCPDAAGTGPSGGHWRPRSYPRHAGCLPPRKGDPRAIIRRAEQTNGDLQRSVGGIRLLGPESVTVAAGAVRLSQSWPALDIIEAVDELDDDGAPPDKPADEEAPVEALSRRVQSVSEALSHFHQMAANEVQIADFVACPGALAEP